MNSATKSYVVLRPRRHGGWNESVNNRAESPERKQADWEVNQE
jgi:hypothetical protein